MARNYRKVDQAVAVLRKAAGALAAVDTRDEMTAYAAVGALKAWVPEALELLLAGTNVVPSEDFVTGYDVVAALAVPLPFPEA